MCSFMVKINMQRRKRYIITFLFLVYFLFYVVSPLYYAEDSCPCVHFFIKKAKAVLSSNNTAKTAQSESEFILLNDYFPQIESVTFSAEFTDADPRQGFYSLSSGLSPPRV